MVRAFTSRAVNLGLFPSRVKLMTLKLVFTAFLLDAQHQRDIVNIKPVSLLVVPLGKALGGISPFWCGETVGKGTWRDFSILEW